MTNTRKLDNLNIYGEQSNGKQLMMHLRECINRRLHSKEAIYCQNDRNSVDAREQAAYAVFTVLNGDSSTSDCLPQMANFMQMVKDAAYDAADLRDISGELPWFVLLGLVDVMNEIVQQDRTANACIGYSEDSLVFKIMKILTAPELHLMNDRMTIAQVEDRKNQIEDWITFEKDYANNPLFDKS